MRLKGEPPRRMAILLLSTDLMVVSWCSAAARSAGAMLETVSSADALPGRIETSPVRLVLLDLGMAGLDPQALVPRLRASSPQEMAIVAFGPHVHRERLSAAEHAGCDRVLSRGELHAGLDDLLGSYLHE